MCRIFKIFVNQLLKLIMLTMTFKLEVNSVNPKYEILLRQCLKHRCVYNSFACNLDAIVPASSWKSVWSSLWSSTWNWVHVTITNVHDYSNNYSKVPKWIRLTLRLRKNTRLRSLEGQMRSFPAKYTELIA